MHAGRNNAKAGELLSSGQLSSLRDSKPTGSLEEHKLTSKLLPLSQNEGSPERKTAATSIERTIEGRFGPLKELPVGRVPSSDRTKNQVYFLPSGNIGSGDLAPIEVKRHSKNSLATKLPTITHSVSVKQKLLPVLTSARDERQEVESVTRDLRQPSGNHPNHWTHESDNQMQSKSPSKKPMKELRQDPEHQTVKTGGTQLGGTTSNTPTPQRRPLSGIRATRDNPSSILGSHATSSPKLKMQLESGKLMSSGLLQTYKHRIMPKTPVVSMTQPPSRKNSLNGGSAGVSPAKESGRANFYRDVIGTQEELPELKASQRTRTYINTDSHQDRGASPPLGLLALKKPSLNSLRNVPHSERILNEAENTAKLARKWLKLSSASDYMSLNELLDSNLRAERILQAASSTHKSLSSHLLRESMSSTGVGSAAILPSSYDAETLQMLSSKFSRDLTESTVLISRLEKELASLDLRLNPQTSLDKYLSVMDEQLAETRAKIISTQDRLKQLKARQESLAVLHKERSRLCVIQCWPEQARLSVRKLRNNSSMLNF